MKPIRTQKSVVTRLDPRWISGADMSEKAVCPYCGKTVVGTYPENTLVAVETCCHFTGFVSGGWGIVCATFAGWSDEILEQEEKE